MNVRHQEPLWDHAEEFLERLELASPPHRGWKAEWATLKEFAGRLDLNQAERHDRELAGLGNSLELLYQLEDAREIRACALQLVAAQCCGFLEYANTDGERWLPYKRWAAALQPGDTVITFNYDRVVESLDQESEPKQCWYPLPDTARALRNGNMDPRPCVLKLHGSVDWAVAEERLKLAVAEPGVLDSRAAMRTGISDSTSPLATPGLSKHDAVKIGGRLAELWSTARDRVATATHIVFVGYRIPPTDSHSREWILGAIREAARASSRLPIYTVLGADIGSTDSNRLRGMLGKIPKVVVTPEPMFAEDFLAVFDRDRFG